MTSPQRMKCRFCESPEWIYADATKGGGTATSYDTCLFRCPTCGVAYSNAGDPAKRTAMWPSPAASVPAEVQDGLEGALAAALNAVNRSSKRQKFAFETSEDAVTWTAFRFLHDTGRHATALGLRSVEPVELLIWGSKWPPSQGCQLLSDLIAVEDALGEARDGRSEPDVVLRIGGVLTFVEVKVRESNTRASSKELGKFARYLRGNEHLFDAGADVTGSRLYELTRNWVIGNLLADRRGEQFQLINLGREQCRDSAQEFQALLNGRRRDSFRFITWAEFLADASSYPAWVHSFLTARGVLGDGRIP